MRSHAKITNWDAYYEKPFKASSVTRSITSSRLLAAIKKAGVSSPLRIAELGGANSCFFETFCRELKPIRYDVFDKNQIGLQKFKNRTGQLKLSSLSDAYGVDLLQPFEARSTYNLVFSVGLIEHFDCEQTARLIESHLDLVEPGGYVLMSYPTPTPIYRLIRWCAERLGIWIFHDERPLRFSEVRSVLEKRNVEFIDRGTNWAIGLTQEFVVVRKR